MTQSSSKKIIQQCNKNFTSSRNLNKDKPTGRLMTVATQTKNDKASQLIEGKNFLRLRHLSQQMEIGYTSNERKDTTERLPKPSPR